MKSFHKILRILLTSIAIAGMFTACKKDSESTPIISYIRVTNPESSDSLLVHAYQGQLLAIVGDNLQGATEVWFNDQASRLTPTYITKNTIIVRVPAQLPNTVNNKLKIVFQNGYVLWHDFQVQISKPALNAMMSEYVKEGDIATITGDYFYAPLTVTFNGGVTGDVVSLKDQEIQVRVPAGAQAGPITVKSSFGESKSNFWFRDNRNLLLSFDPFEGWWGSDYLIDGSDPLAISGNFLRIKKAIGPWAWTEFAGGPESSLSTNHNFPDDAAVNPAKYDLKFEINTLKPYNASAIRIQIGQIFDPQPNPNEEPYQWLPPYDTKGKWETITIPFEEVSANYNLNWGVRPQGYGARVWFQGDGSLNADIAFDNLRVVPKVSK